MRVPGAAVSYARRCLCALFRGGGCSGDAILLVLAKEDAIKSWRALMGPTDPEKARQEAPHRYTRTHKTIAAEWVALTSGSASVVCSIRALYASNTTFNAVHGSDSPKSARREIVFFFPSGTRASFTYLELASAAVSSRASSVGGDGSHRHAAAGDRAARLRPAATAAGAGAGADGAVQDQARRPHPVAGRLAAVQQPERTHRVRACIRSPGH